MSEKETKRRLVVMNIMFWLGLLVLFGAIGHTDYLNDQRKHVPKHSTVSLRLWQTSGQNKKTPPRANSESGKPNKTNYIITDRRRFVKR